MKNILQRAVATMDGHEIDHHASDLYLKVTNQSKKLVEEYEYKESVTTFTDQIDHVLWYDIPFAWYGREVSIDKLSRIEIVLENCEVIFLTAEQLAGFHILETRDHLKIMGEEFVKATVAFSIKKSGNIIYDSFGVPSEHTSWERIEFNDITQLWLHYKDGTREVFSLVWNHLHSHNNAFQRTEEVKSADGVEQLFVCIDDSEDKD